MNGLTNSQLLVLGFFVAALAALIVILVADPSIYLATLKAPAGSSSLLPVAFVAALVVFLAAVSFGVVRRWRWIFWLILLAFLAGLLRIAAAPLELLGVLPGGGPAWYVLFQAAVGLIQFAIAMALIRGYRRGGAWAAF